MQCETLNRAPPDFLTVPLKNSRKLLHFSWTSPQLLWTLELPAVVVRMPNSENCLDLLFAAPRFEKVIIVHVPATNYITSAIRKFMSDMPRTGNFQNMGLLIWAQQDSEEHVKPCSLNRVKVLMINWKSSCTGWKIIECWLKIVKKNDDPMHPHRVTEM